MTTSDTPPNPSQKSLGEANYEQFADRYAEGTPTKPHNAYYEWPATRSLLPRLDGLHVLDAGCGPGHYCTYLLDRGATVTAFDVTPRFVEITRERVAAYPAERVSVLRADLNAPLDFAQDTTYDVVLCSLVLDYIEDWGPVFVEFFRVLKRGGTLVFSAGHPATDYFVYGPQGSAYFATELISFAWSGFGEPRPVVTSYRRPLTAFINPLVQAGFTLDHLLEPLPTEAYRQADPEGHAQLMQRPGFLCVRARKP